MKAWRVDSKQEGIGGCYMRLEWRPN